MGFILLKVLKTFTLQRIPNLIVSGILPNFSLDYVHTAAEGGCHWWSLVEISIFLQTLHTNQ
ncbi:hypothetical protein AB205_0216790 [Aquarana catesbeiana]|uniref:Uncharacterized protein n=1 Tax=Aquarana catesbeiana TaxID=8400 RepID=A0A2G9SM60_AQUCT|nr:hypothetical protein AB205_0216790 [Aquarana catesbeiana]